VEEIQYRLRHESSQHSISYVNPLLRHLFLQFRRSGWYAALVNWTTIARGAWAKMKKPRAVAFWLSTICQNLRLLRAGTGMAGCWLGEGDTVRGWWSYGTGHVNWLESGFLRGMRLEKKWRITC